MSKHLRYEFDADDGRVSNWEIAAKDLMKGTLNLSEKEEGNKWRRIKAPQYVYGLDRA